MQTPDAAPVSRLDAARDIAARGMTEPIPADLLKALVEVADAASYQVQHYAGDTTVTLNDAVRRLYALD